MKNVLFYYGYLNSFNSARNAWTNDLVCDDIAHHYDAVVLGDGLEAPTHPDYANTTYIIGKLKTIDPAIGIFGYVDTTSVSGTFNTNVDNWNTLKVHGIFMDKAGYDFGTNRTAFNTKVDYVHGKLFSNLAFANAWNMNHVLGTVNDASYPNTTYNSGLVASHLTASDYLLLESFGILSTTGAYEDPLECYNRAQTAIQMRMNYGVKLMSVSAISNSDTSAQAKFDFIYTLANQYQLEGCGSSDTNYGASSAAVTFWNRKHLAF